MAAILNNMHMPKGHCVVSGSIAYAAQEAWLFNATLKENILFGMPFDEDKYDNVIWACSLRMDLEILPNGDQTEVCHRNQLIHFVQCLQGTSFKHCKMYTMFNGSLL